MIPLPPLLTTWTGFVAGITGILLLTWVHAHLGKEWSVNLWLNDDHRLIKTGPYARVRHPMYSALFLVYLGLGIITANYLILVFIILSIISIYRRIPDEEKMLKDKFGDEYVDYSRRTGKLFPKF